MTFLDTITNYFESIPSSHRTLLLVGGLTFFWLIEGAAPLFTFKYNKWKHARINIFFTLTTILVNFSLAFLLLSISEWTQANNFGILQWLKMGGWLYLISGVLLMDLIGAYLIHYVEHKIPWMWQFHIVHHMDQEIDTTSANRHHPGESVFRLIFTCAAVWIIGAPVWMIFLYQSMSVVLTQFNHANISMPEWLNRMLVVVFCTPDMHRVHHHYRRPYTDSNYGNIFSFWDRMFRTYQSVPNEKLRYGIDTEMDPAHSSSISYMLKIPFTPYKPSPVYKEEEKLS